MERPRAGADDEGEATIEPTRGLACASCGRLNPPNSRFCNGCGQALNPVGSEPPANLPLDLADKIRAQSFQPGEHKQVTALFVDVVESMVLAERLGAEGWRALVDRVFSLLCRAMHSYEGTVQDFTGDGILALFGAPIAHEDHAQRGCYAALQIIDEMPELATDVFAESGVELALRIGINSGEVVVGAIGEDLNLEYTAIGHSIGLAQRMESLAEPGTVCVSEQTAALVSGYFELSDRGAFEVKGAGSQRVFRLIGAGGARDKFERSRSRGLSSFVGRADELKVLSEALRQAEDGAGRTVGISADAGTGKSRLAAEFVAGCRERGISVYEAHTRSYGRAMPLLPVKELLRSYFGISEADSEQHASHKAVGTILELDRGLEAEVPLILDLLDLSDSGRPLAPMTAEARQRRLLAAMRRLVIANGRRETSVTLIEDLHWLDPGSEVLLDNLVASVSGGRSLVLLTFRPEYRPGWDAALPYRELPLPPLGGAAVERLVRELLGGDPSLEGLAELLVERTGGNPFFVEEAVAELHASGALEGSKGAYRLIQEVEDLEVPASVQATLAARIDRLGEQSKAALQAAATIGGDFDRGLLAPILQLAKAELDDALEELLAAGLIARTPIAPESDYQFRHPLIREVAYRSQLTEARARKHLAIAATIQELEPERLDERAGLIADHYDAAGEALEAARWHLRAGEQWAKDIAGGMRHLRLVRDLDPDLPQGGEVDLLRSGSRLLMINIAMRVGGELEECRLWFEEGRAVAERGENTETLALLHGAFALAVQSFSGNFTDASAHGYTALRIARRLDDPAPRAAGLSRVSWPIYAAGHYRDALAAADEVLELTEEDYELGTVKGTIDNPRTLATLLRAPPLWSMGRIREARAALAQAVELAERWSVEALSQAHALHALAAMSGVDVVGDESVRHAHRAYEIAEELGEVHELVMAGVSLGGIQARTGDWRAAETVLLDCLALIDERGVGLGFEPMARCLLAEATAAAGDLDRAVSDGEAALRLTDERGNVSFAPRARMLLARTLIRRGHGDDSDRAGELLEAAARIADRSGGLLDLAVLEAVRAERSAYREEADHVQESLANAREMARSIDARGLSALLG